MTMKSTYERRLERGLCGYCGKVPHKRMVAAKGASFYSVLKKLGFPKDPPLVVACYNCNMARGVNRECPHHKERESMNCPPVTFIA